MENAEKLNESTEQKPVNFEIIQSLEDVPLVIRVSRNPEFGLQGKFGRDWHKAMSDNKKWFMAWQDAVDMVLKKYYPESISGTGDATEKFERKVTGLTEDQIGKLLTDIEELAGRIFEDPKQNSFKRFQ